MRRGARAGFGAFVVAAAATVAMPTAAHADPGGAMTAVDGFFTGTPGDDLLVIAHDGDFLSHNRVGAGDPGFASSLDFDSTVAGEQTKAVGATITLDAGAGNDTLQIVGALDYPVAAFNGGDGVDTLDMANAGNAASLGPSFGRTYPTVERFLGSSAADVVQADSFAATGAELQGRGGDDTLAGTAGGDQLIGGAGANTLDGGGGNDALSVSVPLNGVLRQITGGAGDDTFVVAGSESADNLVVDGTVPTLVTAANNADGGYRTDAEHVNLGLNLGDDSVHVTPSPAATVVVDGASGNDSLVIDAQRRSAAVTEDPAAAAFVDIAGFGRVSALVVENLRVVNEMLVATAPGRGGGPHVRTFRGDSSPVASFFAYAPSFTGGVNVALGDLDGDGNDEIITGAGPGGGPHVRVFSSTGADAGIGFFAYAPEYAGGVNVAAVDVDGDGDDEIVTTPASAGGPHVRIWNGNGQLRNEWLATPLGNAGLFVARGAGGGGAAGDQIVLSAAAGGQSLVRVYEPGGALADEFDPYSPYGATFTGGAAVARGEFATADRALDGLHDEIVTGAGPGGGPHVRVVEKAVSGNGYSEVAGFYAYNPNFHGGVSVATCNVDGGDDEVLTGAGAGGGPHVRLFSKTGVPLVLSFMAYDPGFGGGIRVACGGAETRTF